MHPPGYYHRLSLPAERRERDNWTTSREGSKTSSDKLDTDPLRTIRRQLKPTGFWGPVRGLCLQERYEHRPGPVGNSDRGQ